MKEICVVLKAILFLSCTGLSNWCVCPSFARCKHRHQ